MYVVSVTVMSIEFEVQKYKNNRHVKLNMYFCISIDIEDNY